MSFTEWTTLFLLNSLWWLWISNLGGAHIISGYDFMWDWSEKQVKFYGRLIWLFTAIVFVFGVFVPDIRAFNFSFL